MTHKPDSPVPATPPHLHMAEGWMCRVAFDHEVGNALGGNTVYPSADDLKKHLTCCVEPDEYCGPKRVYVVDADAYDVARAGVPVEQRPPTMSEQELMLQFEDAAHEIHGDASQYLAKTSHDGHDEYVKGDVNSSWIFFKAGYEFGAQGAVEQRPSAEKL